MHVLIVLLQHSFSDINHRAIKKASNHMKYHISVFLEQLKSHPSHSHHNHQLRERVSFQMAAFPAKTSSVSRMVVTALLLQLMVLEALPLTYAYISSCEQNNDVLCY